ncbi:MAG TPA: tetratricopeptide repeat protein [Candidatus Acidoferrum sp.]|nr:tetratricopeptide repeat protein [Candidatus Acidoferrum sp.]
MSRRIRIFVLLAIALALLVPGAVAQKPPAPAPAPVPPTSAPPNIPANPSPSSSSPSQPSENLVMFLGGRVAIQDGAPIPNDVLIERVCNNRARQEVYASPHGDFSMQLGSRADSFPEASIDPSSPYSVANKDSVMGIPESELKNCELRVSASGFRSRVIPLLGLDTFGGSIDVGVVTVERGKKVEGTTLDATLYKAPKDARTAYEKGLQAERKGKLADAHKYFETAVELYPSFTNAWFQLGTVLQKENQKDEARKAYTQATTLDSRYLPPYLFLTLMAYEAENWTEVLKLTGHILDLDPLSHSEVTGYIIDLDPLNYAEAYFYNSFANYKLNKFEAAEKSALKAQHLDLRTRFPQLHLILAEVFARKNQYDLAISEIQTYLALAPNAKDAAQEREQLAKLEKLNISASTTDKPDQR